VYSFPPRLKSLPPFFAFYPLKKYRLRFSHDIENGVGASPFDSEGFSFPPLSRKMEGRGKRFAAVVMATSAKLASRPFKSLKTCLPLEGGPQLRSSSFISFMSRCVAYR